MSVQRNQAAAMVGGLWLTVIALSAAGAFGPVHRTDLSPYWSSDFFITMALGPLAVLRGRSPATQLATFDYAFAIVLAVVVVGLCAVHILRPRRSSGWAVVVSMALWLLLGLSVTYAWV